jgi:hypothetical protein
MRLRLADDAEDRGLTAVGVDGINIRQMALSRIEGKSLYC